MALGTDYLLKYKIVADAYSAKAEIKSVDDALKSVGARAATSFGSFGVAAGTAIAAITGVAGSLFALSKEAAEYGSAIHDASDKTGLHAETLSAMGLAAKQSNTELEQITTGVAKFSKTVGAAAEDTKKAQKFFDDFGIKPQEAINDLDVALGKVFKRIADARPGIEQTTLAQKAFGKSGADLLPFIKQFDGDLPKLIAKAKELGVTLTDQDAAAADEFGDQMDQLSVQIGAATRAIGQEFMPAFTAMAADVSDWLAKNKGETKSWADSFAEYLTDISFKIKLLALDAREAAAEISALLNSGLLADKSKPTALDLPAIMSKYAKERQDLIYGGTHPQYGPYSYEYAPDKKTGGGPSTLGGGSGKKDKIGDAAPSRRAVEVLKAVISPSKFDAAMQMAADQVSKETGVDKDIIFTMLKATLFRESSGIPGQTSEAGAKGLTQQLPGTSKRLGPGSEFVKAARYLTRGFGGEGYEAGGPAEAFATYFAGGSGTGRGAKTKSYVTDQTWVFNRAKAILEGQQKVTDELKKGNEEQLKNDQEAADRKYEIGQTTAESLIELAKQEYESSLKYNQFDAAVAAAKEVHDRTVQNVDDEIAVLEEKAAATKAGSEEERRAVDAVTLARVRGDIAIQRADKDLADSIDSVQSKQADFFIDLTENADKAKDAIDRLGDGFGSLMDDVVRSTNAQAEHAMDNPSHGSFLDALFGGLGIDEMQSDIDQRKAMLADLGSFTADIFGAMANAVGQSIEAWALYGESLGTALKKATAQVLAQVAAQAAVKAIFELAEGFASLAIGDAYGATMHFTAAAIYGTVAVGAAVGAKLVAGDSFKSKGGKGASSGAGGGSSSSAQNTTPYSRSGPDTFISGRRPQDPATMALAMAVDKLQAKIDGMSPGDVLVRGTAQRPGHVTQQVVGDLGKNASYSKQIAVRMRVK